MRLLPARPSYPGYLIIRRVINLLKETFGRGIVRAEMMTTESATKAESAPIVFKTGPIVWPGLAAVTYIVLLSLTGHCQHGCIYAYMHICSVN